MGQTGVPGGQKIANSIGTEGGGGLDPGGGGVRAGGGLTVLLANERHSARYTQSNDFVAKFVSTKRRYQVRFHRDRLFNVNRSLTP